MVEIRAESLDIQESNVSRVLLNELLWELGLIYDIEFPKPSEVIIHMTLTAPGCPIADEIVQQVHDVVMEVEGIESATVNLVFEPAWTPDRMSDVAKLELGYDI